MNETYDLFDDEDTDGYPMKHFQVGWQVGLSLKIKSLLIGASYGADFSEIAENVKVHTTSVTLGVCF